jgi:hypothetical protein
MFISLARSLPLPSVPAAFDSTPVCRSGERSQSDACPGYIVSLTTAINWAFNCSRFTSLRSVVLKAASVLAAS